MTTTELEERTAFNKLVVNRISSALTLLNRASQIRRHDLPERSAYSLITEALEQINAALHAANGNETHTPAEVADLPNADLPGAAAAALPLAVHHLHTLGGFAAAMQTGACDEDFRAAIVDVLVKKASAGSLADLARAMDFTFDAPAARVANHGKSGLGN